MTEDQCKFAHHWIPDYSDVLDEEALELEDAFQMLLREDGPFLVIGVLASLILLVVVVKMAMNLVTNNHNQFEPLIQKYRASYQ